MENVNLETGEIVGDEKKLGKLIIKRQERNQVRSRKRITMDFSQTISKCDTTGAHEADLNYLIKKYSPNDLISYLAISRPQQAIQGHDFSKEPDKQGQLNEVKRLNDLFDQLDPQIKKEFGSTLEFLKFIDNKQNVDKMLKMGLLSQKQVDEVKKAPEKTQELKTELPK